MLADFALKSAGGYVTSTPNTVPYQINESSFIGLINTEERSNPEALLQPGILPGQCFAFEGSKGRIRIHLSRKINITNVTLEHVPRNLVDDNGRTAPKEFEVFVNYAIMCLIGFILWCACTGPEERYEQRWNSIG